MVSSLNAFAKEYNDAYTDVDETNDETAQNKEDWCFKYLGYMFKCVRVAQGLRMAANFN